MGTRLNDTVACRSKGAAADQTAVEEAVIGERRFVEHDVKPEDVLDNEADDSAIVVTLDENGRDDLGDDDGADDGDGEGDDGDGDHDGEAGWAQPGRQPDLSDERRDRVVVMVASALAAGVLLLMGGILLAGALGWIQPTCGGVFVTQTAGCSRETPSYETVEQAPTPDWSRYRLATPVGQGQITP